MTSGRNLDSLRRGNLSSVLGIVHKSGMISRSQITAKTGLNRSTVAALIMELTDRELVVESEPEATNRVGRPSPMVAAHPSPVAIAVNPELDAVTVGVVGLSAKVIHRVRHEVDHPVTPLETASIVAHVVDDLRKGILLGHRVLGIGIAVPGLVGSDAVVRWAPHLEWTDARITELIEAEVGLPVRVDNDATLGALAEWQFGVGRGVDDMVYLNGSPSGIGGGVIAGGRVLAGRSGYAGEFGHNRPGLAAESDRLTKDGTLEDEVSQARLLETVGLGSADEVELETIVLASKDSRVLDELARQRRILSVSISNAVNVLNPALVVLGGFLATVYASDPAALEDLVASQSVAAAWSDTAIKRAALGPDLLMIGAAELAFLALVNDPARRYITT